MSERKCEGCGLVFASKRLRSKVVETKPFFQCDHHTFCSKKCMSPKIPSIIRGGHCLYCLLTHGEMPEGKTYDDYFIKIRAMGLGDSSSNLNEDFLSNLQCSSDSVEISGFEDVHALRKAYLKYLHQDEFHSLK